MSTFPRIYLASQSPRRQQLLTQIGVSFDLLLPDNTQQAEAMEAFFEGETPRTYVRRVTLLKLKAALLQRQTHGLSSQPILTADTTVTLRGKVFGKPVDAADALRMLRQLSGQTHQVLTAVALGEGRRRLCRVQSSNVTFQPLTDSEMADYVSTGEPMGKAGAYAIQGAAAGFVKKITGSHSGIMGLPLFETRQMLLEWMKD
jgi:septum formation protein